MIQIRSHLIPPPRLTHQQLEQLRELILDEVITPPIRTMERIIQRMQDFIPDEMMDQTRNYVINELRQGEIAPGIKKVRSLERERQLTGERLPDRNEALDLILQGTADHHHGQFPVLRQLYLWEIWAQPIPGMGSVPLRYLIENWHTHPVGNMMIREITRMLTTSVDIGTLNPRDSDADMATENLPEV